MIELVSVVPRGSAEHVAGRPGAPGVTMSVPGGQSLALYGHPHDAATGLFDVLAGLATPRSGEVWVDGVAVHRLRGTARDRYRARRGLVSPRFGLLPSLSVSDNVLAAPPAPGAPAPTAARAAQLLELVGLPALTGPVTGLMAEEQWRVMIARALAPAPRLLLAEDPASSLGSRAAGRILDVLADVHEGSGCTLVLLAAHPATAARCQRRVLITQTTVAEDELTSGDDAWTRSRIDRIG
ncbi:MAG TPA: ATP-binding cassette domain-containing protein [Trebonia sp.]